MSNNEQALSCRLSSLDLDAWRQDLQRLHVTIDEVVQTFISSQTCQLDAVATQLASQRDKIIMKEKNFSELSDSIASFVEAEARRLQGLGFDVLSPEDASREAYDADLPGPPALHRINRLWRKATKAFESTQQAKTLETAAALEEQRLVLESRRAQVENEKEQQITLRDQEISALKEELEVLRADGEQKDGAKAALSLELEALRSEMRSSQDSSAELESQVRQLETLQKRLDYEWSAEREEMVRSRDAAEAQAESTRRSLDEALEKGEELEKKCLDRAEKLEQMRKIMDEQELEMSQKIERVQQYVKERQTTAIMAEKKQQDAEKMAERWQNEVRRCQAEKERLAAAVLDMEGRQSGQAQQMQGAVDQHRRQVTALEDALRRKEDQMREQNLELLSRRDEEYQAKVALEKQREKECSIALLKKKEQEVHIKDQQLRAAKQRIQDLESELRSTATSAGSEKQRPTCSRAENSALPPLPLSAR